MATSEQIEEFKDLYDVAGLSDEEIAIIIGAAPGQRERFNEQRQLGGAMRREGRKGSSYDPRTGINMSGGVLGLGADIFERYRGRKQEKEATAGLEGLEADDKERMGIYIRRMLKKAEDMKAAQADQIAQIQPNVPTPQGPMGPPAPQAQPPLGQPPLGQPPLGQPSPQIPMQPSPLANMPQGNVSVGPVPGSTSPGYSPGMPALPPANLPALDSPANISGSIAEELRRRRGAGRKQNEQSEMKQISNFLRMLGSS